MYYFDYFIKYLIRRLTRIVFKPRNILIIVIILLISAFLTSSCFAADNLFSFYDNCANDLVNRLSNFQNTDEFYKYLTNGEYNYLIYYDNLTASKMVDNNYNTTILFVAFLPTTFNSSGTVLDGWAGFAVSGDAINYYNSVNNNNKDLVVFSFNTGLGEVQKLSTSVLYYPSNLLSYKPSIITTYLQDYRNTQQITSSITESTDKIDNTISSTDYDDSVVNIDTSSADIDDSSSINLFTTIFTNFSNLLNSSNWQTVETIDIPVPNTDKYIQIRSDILSDIIGGTFIETLINTAWYSIFGLYAFKFSTKIFQAIKSGDILTGLNLSDEVITSTMM